MLQHSRARQEYRQRIAELRMEIEEAEGARDLGRVERAQGEMDQLAAALARAFGLGGRDSLAGTRAERARLNVTRAIRATIRRIGVVHPALAQHLDRTVVTGRFRSYQPNPLPRIDWRF